MILGSMQPYFFPYLGYFDLINCADKWIVFDTVQYIRHGWINRNRIHHPKEGWQYIIVPLTKHSHDAAIKDVEIDHGQPWKQRIVGQLQHYKRVAPYFRATMQLVDGCLASDEDSISRLNAFILEHVCAHLGLHFEPNMFSHMDLELGAIEEPADWSLRMAEALGAEEYVNPPGGANIYDARRFADHGVKLTIRHLPPMEYRCGRYEFIPSLSIIDLLMFNQPEEIKTYLDQHRYGT